MFAMIITDMNEKIDEQTAMINVLMAHEHEIKQQENIVFEVEPWQHQNENLVDKKVFDGIYNDQLATKVIEEELWRSKQDYLHNAKVLLLRMGKFRNKESVRSTEIL